MKIHILFSFQEGPRGGGGNQFLKALKQKWLDREVYEQDITKADVVLFNSHHFLKNVLRVKSAFPKKIFIHRIDGPLRTYRPKEKLLDRLIFKINIFVADGTVWQSEWSKKENEKIFPYSCPFQAVVYNAPDEAIFNKKGKTGFKNSDKIKIIAVSWSNNFLKGFDTYEFLDNNLDFERYEMVFVGRNPVGFKNIKTLGVLEQRDLAIQLKQSDIFITASKIESCSNALIEALSCGLPCLAFNSSSNPEIIKGGGELFDNEEELLEKIEKMSANYSKYQENLPIFSLDKAASMYYELAAKIFNETQGGFYFTREVGTAAKISFYWLIVLKFFRKVFNKLTK